MESWKGLPKKKCFTLWTPTDNWMRKNFSEEFLLFLTEFCLLFVIYFYMLIESISKGFQLVCPKTEILKISIFIFTVHKGLIVAKICFWLWRMNSSKLKYLLILRQNCLLSTFWNFWWNMVLISWRLSVFGSLQTESIMWFWKRNIDIRKSFIFPLVEKSVPRIFIQ